ncbi:MAG: hypothetical protein P1P89_15700 [Desulfobacterales bacterium]|nr:hypothetical protein [Desulfobacterales bacterium]
MIFGSQLQSRMLPVVLVFIFIFLTACARGGGAQRAETQPQAEQQAQAGTQPEAVDPPLPKKYNSIVVFDFETTPEVKTDYPDAARECQVNVITDLQIKNVYHSVAPHKPGAAYGAGTLLVKAKIKEMRLVSTGARIWGGAFAGSSYINMDVIFIDAETKQEVRKKEMNSATNAWAAAWTSGSSDRSLTADMGKIIAEYIVSVVPKN